VETQVEVIEPVLKVVGVVVVVEVSLEAAVGFEIVQEVALGIEALLAQVVFEASLAAGVLDWDIAIDHLVNW